MPPYRKLTEKWHFSLSLWRTHLCNILRISFRPRSPAFSWCPCFPERGLSRDQPSPHSSSVVPLLSLILSFPSSLWTLTHGHLCSILLDSCYLTDCCITPAWQGGDTLTQSMLRHTVESFCPLNVLVRCYFETSPNVDHRPHPSPAPGLLLSVQTVTHNQGTGIHTERCLVSTYIIGKVRNYRLLALPPCNFTASHWT